MTARARTIKLDSDTADRLAAWARERGLTVAELLAELAAGIAGEHDREILVVRP